MIRTFSTNVNNSWTTESGKVSLPSYLAVSVSYDESRWNTIEKQAITSLRSPLPSWSSWSSWWSRLHTPGRQCIYCSSFILSPGPYILSLFPAHAHVNGVPIKLSSMPCSHRRRTLQPSDQKKLRNILCWASLPERWLDPLLGSESLLLCKILYIWSRYER